jgi:hypothetical protein
MPSHKISLVLSQPIEVQYSDVDIEVTSDGAMLGRLKISRGSIDWLPARNRVNYYELTWEHFAELMEQLGTPRQLTQRATSAGTAPTAVTESAAATEPAAAPLPAQAPPPAVESTSAIPIS